MSEILNIILLTLTPALELRASIPYGVFKTELSLISIFIIAVITNIILAPIIYLFLDNFLHLFQRITLFDKYYQKVVLKTQKKIHPYIEKYGVYGLALFIAVPLPGSGVYTGALGAYLLGFRKRDFLLAASIGVVIAGIIVTLISVSGDTALAMFLKDV
ncbi:hypothetical protein COV12_02400 [Candidatus Woesearchaeota archaeon CG10_big_fil_rev_8_21_14_0_10_32_24]|nr:MAG: hypothetical protein COV12_02400 [Candidatus Woesearchaeota archaeon CG10_big_fil_rev_8_21_14_0_10_32_24]